MKSILLSLLACSVLAAPSFAQEGPTYAERLGYPKGAKVALFHSDDLGMFIDGNRGTIQSVEEGIVTSSSTMMPTGWVTHWAKYLEEHPDFDNGLHLTLTSEWKYYRWGPVAGVSVVPGLVDEDGHLWHSVEQVVASASPEEVEIEIRAQIAKARGMGLPITHMDSHMGTLFATPEFLSVYCKVGMDENIPVMLMGGHMTVVSERYKDDPNRDARYALLRGLAKQVWDSGLPILDDLYTEITSTRDLDEKKKVIKEALTNQAPGVTMYIVHCTNPSEIFSDVSGSGPNRHSDTLAMSDPEIIQFIKDEGIILTTWKELDQRRKALKE